MDRVTKATLVLCVVALATASGEEPPAAAANPVFDGCEITASEPGARSIKCEGVIASVFTGNAAPETMIEASLNGLRGGFKGPVIPRKVEVSIGGAKRPGLRVSLFAKDGEHSIAEGVIVAVPADADNVRVINCAGFTTVAGSEARRDRMVQALADSLPAATTASEPSEWGPSGTTLAGRMLTVAEDCTLISPGRIRCEVAELSWRHGTKGFDIMAVIGPLRIEYSKLGKVKETIVKCRLQGEQAQCRVFAVQPAEGETVSILVGMGAVRGQGLLAECDSVAGLSDVLPAPCDQVFSLE